MSIKTFVKEHCPESLLPLVKIPYRIAAAPYRKIKHSMRVRMIEKRAMKYLPYYQDELSRDVFKDQINFYMTGNKDIFLRRAERIGMRFLDIEGITGEGHTINKSDANYSGITVLYDHESDDLDYVCRLLLLCEWSDRYRSLTLNEFLNGKKIPDTELIVPVLSDSGRNRFEEYVLLNHLQLCIFDRVVYSVREDLQYFDVFSPMENEIIVDAGSFNGKTAIQFLEWGKENVKKIYSFEFDPVNAVKCEENLRPYSDKVTLIKKGTWDKDETVYVNASGEDWSRVGNKGNVEVQLTSIDSALKEEHVTLIKMDIEGAELKALVGARNTILREHPRLVICMYHKQEDLYEIPEYILSLVPEYKFYLRHYNSREWGTVLYAYCE